MAWERNPLLSLEMTIQYGVELRIGAIDAYVSCDSVLAM
jgi:hypothetical protein